MPSVLIIIFVICNIAKTFYIFTSGELVRRENTLCLKTQDEEKRFLPVVEVEQIFLFGENTFNTKLVDFLSQNKIVLHLWLELFKLVKHLLGEKEYSPLKVWW
uniref:Uncharacterized protein n=1 Tax=candidate division WOR-3 bacterium TaxID=2052148 RepID=A0A7V0Z5L3_UNCW3